MSNSSLVTSQYFRCAGVQLDLALGLMTNAAGESQRLSPVNLKLLAYLLQHQGELISRTDLFAAIWPNQLLSDDVLTRAVSDIRTQLARLDADARFIETLPKRGYRWALAAHPASAPGDRQSEPLEPTVVEVPAAPRQNRHLVTALAYGLSALIVALLFMGWLGREMAQPVVRMALLPVVSEGAPAASVAQVLEAELAQQLGKNPRIKLLSKTAIAARPANPFPYFFNEFGAHWVLESRVNISEGGDNIELSLVDARTGLEVRRVHFEAMSSASLAAVLARKLELLQELPLH